MSKMNIFAAISNRVLAAIQQSRVTLAIQQSRIIISESALGVFITGTLKAIVDAASANDLIAKVFGKRLNDTSVANDAAAKVFNTNKNDTVGSGDLHQLGVSKILSDAVQTSDTVSFQLDYVRTLQDLGLATDQFSRTVNYNRQFTDSVSILDIASLTEGGPVQVFDAATASVNDQISLQVAYQRSIEEIVLATDDIGGEATIDDNQTIQFFKQITSLFQATDESVRFAGKVVSDILGATDSGTLLNQGYVDNPFYFAEDYVGVKRTF